MPPPPRNPRRSTLGPVSMNAATPSKVPKPASSSSTRKSRQSMLPRVGRENLVPPSPSASVSTSTSTSTSTSNKTAIKSRRSSIGGGGIPPPSSGRTSLLIRQDPRPISDKTYQQSCLQSLLVFLQKSDYPYPVSLKSLQRPSGKDFEHMVTFLLRQVDPTFGTLGDKLEDEVAMHFKSLGYPHVVSKTALVAAGSPHTWPALLAALTWLVELLAVLQTHAEPDDTTSQQGFDSLQELESKTDRAFFDYLHKAYGAFLQGSTQLSDEYTEQLVDRFEQDNMVLEAEIERLTDLNATMVDQLQRLEQHSSILPELQQKRLQYATDLEQFQDLVQQMDHHKAALEQKVQERTMELTNTQEKLSKLTSKMKSLEETIASQELSVQDVQKLQLEQARCKEALEKARLYAQQQQERLDVVRSELGQAFDELEEHHVREYGLAWTEVCLKVPELSKYKIVVHREEAHESVVALLGDVSPDEAVREYNQSWHQQQTQHAQARRLLEERWNAVETCKARLTEEEDRTKIVEFKLSQLEENIETERTQQEATLQVRLTQIQDLQQHHDMAAVEQQIVALTHQCRQLEALSLQYSGEHVAHKRSVQDEVEHALQEIANFERHVQNTFDDLERYALHTKQGLVVTVTSPRKL